MAGPRAQRMAGPRALRARHGGSGDDPHWPLARRSTTIGSMHRNALAVIALLAGAALALLAAPLLMPEDYTWLRHTTSESAAQGLEGAWLARLGFLAFGFAVALAAASTPAWSKAARTAHGLFGVCMILTATFSTRSWDPLQPFARSEDLLHSVAATAMGFAFAAGVLAVAYRRWHVGSSVLLDVVALAASVLLPLAMAAFGDLSGLAQRAMFVIAFAWYAVRTLEESPSMSTAIRASHRRARG
jgi:hypothetical protein